MNFWKLNEALGNYGDEEDAIQAIRSGLNVDEGFWEDFITVMGNSDALSALLQIPKEKITGWASRIRELVEKVNSMDSESNHKIKKKMLNTGRLNIGDNK